ncbi:MAG TPA: hypothetical protein VGG08_02100 [Solirubrobacteraceae bacterium]|jgi:hypothetical protein
MDHTPMPTLLIALTSVWGTTLAFVLSLCRIAAYGTTLAPDPAGPDLEGEGRTSEAAPRAHPAAA